MSKRKSDLFEWDFEDRHDILTEYALAGLGGVVYTALPTMLNLTGVGAMATAYGALFVLGYLFESRALIVGGLLAGVVHVIYRFGGDLTMKWWGRPMWSLGPVTVAAATPDHIGDYLRAGYGYGMHDSVQLPNGYSALALPPGDAPGYNSGAYVQPQQVNDYVNQNDNLMDGDADEWGFMGSERHGQHGGGYDGPSMFE